MTAEDIIARLRQRRDALAAQKQEAEQQAAELRQTLALLQRNIDGMAGAIQEFGEMLEVVGASGNAGQHVCAIQEANGRVAAAIERERAEAVAALAPES